MTPSSSPPSVRLVPMSPVLTRIERELRDLWAAPTKPGEAPKIRVCTMNLIVVTSSRELTERYTPVVDEVTSTTPARAILVTLEPEATTHALEGDTSAVCGIGGSDAVCSERVRLVARGGACVRVASAVEALSVPEIPTTLVWLGRIHVEDPVFVSLAELAQRVVLDTEYTALSSLVKLSKWARAEPGRPAVADLAWLRLGPWQELCARFFDSPALRGHADRVTKLVLKQASEPGARLGSEGNLLLGWLATRLGWKVSRMGGAMRFRRPDGGQVALSLGAVPRPEGVAPLALAYVGIEAEVGDVVAKGSVERALGSGTADTTADADVLVWKLDVDLPSATEQRVRLGANKGAKLLDRAIHRPRVDPVLAETVAFAEQVYEDGLVCS